MCTEMADEDKEVSFGSEFELLLLQMTPFIIIIIESIVSAKQIPR